MNTRKYFAGAVFALAACAATFPAPVRAQLPVDVPVQWSASGTLLEACTCAVPCSCNFGEPPSPHHYCHAVYAYRLDKARWGRIDLSGLTIAGADAEKGGEAYLDERATSAQRAALKSLTRAVWSQGGPGNAPDMPFVFAKITPKVTASEISVSIENVGGFSAKPITGRDGKTPVVVENNTVWPITRAYKGKTVSLAARSKAIGAINTTGTNANYGAFRFAGIGAPVAKVKTKVKTGGECCAAKKAK